MNAELEQRVAERTAELEETNEELQAFCYSVSHDLRQPLRAIDGFSKALKEDYKEAIDEEGQYYLERLRHGAQRMGQLIEDLLALSRTSISEFSPVEVCISELAERILDHLKAEEKERRASWIIQPNLSILADKGMVEILLENLLGNAWKFSSKESETRIEFGYLPNEGEGEFFIKDNGAGFDMKYADKLFGVFQRLHETEEFPGTAIGLATVHRIVQRHRGSIRAESSPGEGATFYFTLGATHVD